MISFSAQKPFFPSHTASPFSRRRRKPYQMSSGCSGALQDPVNTARSPSSPANERGVSQ